MEGIIKMSGFPVAINFGYNLNNFCYVNDPIETLSHLIEMLFEDGLTLLQDGSRIQYNEMFGGKKYPATALYYLTETPQSNSNRNLTSHTNYVKHSESNETHIKVIIQYQIIPFLKNIKNENIPLASFMSIMNYNYIFIKIKNMISSIVNSDVFVELSCMTETKNKDSMVMEFVLERKTTYFN